MNVWNAKQDRRFGRRTTAISVALHVVIGLVLLFAPTLGVFPSPNDDSEVRLVRLKGGGELRPGWIKPTKAAPDDAPVPDNKPQAPKPEPKPTPPPETKPAPSEPNEVEMAPEPAPDPEPEEEIVEDDTPPEEDTAPPPAPKEDDADGDADIDTTAEVDPSTETGAGVGRKPGPEGEGLGAVTDAEFAGSSAYLARIEAEVQRRFNYRGNAAGKVAIYRFTIDRNGRIGDLVLDSSSGVPSLDLSARSALLRAQLPPLPRTYPHQRLGISFHFYGD